MKFYFLWLYVVRSKAEYVKPTAFSSISSRVYFAKFNVKYQTFRNNI